MRAVRAGSVSDGWEEPSLTLPARFNLFVVCFGIRDALDEQGRVAAARQLERQPQPVAMGIEFVRTRFRPYFRRQTQSGPLAPGEEQVAKALELELLGPQAFLGEHSLRQGQSRVAGVERHPR